MACASGYDIKRFHFLGIEKGDPGVESPFDEEKLVKLL